jgi:hypothetical protein
MNAKRRKQGAKAVGSSDVLGGWRIGIETVENLGGETDSLGLGTINDCRAQLAEMLNYPGPMAVLIEALKREGVRFDESDFPHEDITHLNQYVAVIGGEAAEFLHRACESIKSRATTHQTGEDLSLGANSSGFGRLHVSNLSSDVFHKSINVNPPNDPKLSHGHGNEASPAKGGAK